MKSLRLHKTWSLPSLNHAIEEARFTEELPVVPPKREKIGRSPQLRKQ